ncbi:hypothetical protein BGZ80_006650 [Entomortierella chlamydospora]|uniref:Uncharacterized protein n=1 Tax=Entomortierella chlamydospora TaxID=101097 RepID=A0A9P6MH98_9FUNG|nr:hypothetical protein BGZ80_006650 [Entomortierella chlamydospora]
MTESTASDTSNHYRTIDQAPDSSITQHGEIPTPSTVLKADFSITLLSESTSTLNASIQRLMDTIHATPGLSIRGPIRLPRDGKIHSRRVDIKSIQEKQLRTIAEQSGIELSEDAGEKKIQSNGVVVIFDIE